MKALASTLLLMAGFLCGMALLVVPPAVELSAYRTDADEYAVMAEQVRPPGAGAAPMATAVHITQPPQEKESPASPLTTHAPESTPAVTCMPRATQPATAPPSMATSTVDLAACSAQNRDFVAWLTIPGTVIDYPVVRSDNTAYYLHHLFSGKESKLGCLFSLTSADYETPGRNIAIYGHHLSNSSAMFSTLMDYKQAGYCADHSQIRLDTLYGTRTYATAMEGFTLKNISGSVGGFYAGQTGLYGSSGKDSAYPQLAKSAAHGTIYATPHYLEGYTVYCLEHNLSGPGEGSGSSQSAKGPYALVDMDYFVSNPDGGGVTGVQFSARTMHALAWVLRHSYPFMALNRSDANNEVWSRAAGQFAMREVIKQLEGAQYVRSYWDMDSFYAFSGGAPAFYLTYARWLATNAIAHASITGNITVSNQSVSISGSNYIGSVTLTTDADLIRIPRTVGTLTGNTGGSDSSYYYAKSGDTIRVTSSQSRFAITMESMPSDEEEACFLVGIPSVSIQKVLVPVYGSPYPLKSASVTFELSYGEIRVTKQSSDGLLLKDAVFELLNASGAVVVTAATDSTGSAVFPSLQPGSYTVREKTAPQGYSLAASASQNVSVVAGITSTVTFVNERITGRIRIVKTDSITGKPLAGVVFSVTRLSGPASDNATDIGKVVATVTTNDQGVAETGLLPWGEYRLTETGVPAGYLDEGYTTTVWIK